VVFVCRHGRQSLAEVERWPLRKLRWFTETLEKMLDIENPASGDEPED
jgi:hypothetical protein